tara:strand:+ start:3244 stop:3930 length:687 start_codon:yes stop_codon:yes gene_type:complete
MKFIEIIKQMKKEIDLLKNYPKSKRDLSKRLEEKTEIDRKIARKFGKEFFDGTRSQGYGGFNYMPKFWQPVIPTFIKQWNLDKNKTILDVGCAKGFMLHDIKEAIDGIKVNGIDISEYAIENCIESVKDDVQVGDAKNLQFEDDSFDIVISINTVHNLALNECIQAIKEIERVAKQDSFITVDAYRNEEEKKRMNAWNLTAKTIMSVDEWKKLFEEIDYTGDYYWFIP